MRLAVFSSKAYERTALEAANADGHELTFLDARLAPETAPLARGYPAVCAFVNDVVDAATIATLAEGGTRLVLLRAAGSRAARVSRSRIGKSLRISVTLSFMGKFIK